jgi:hypothetical protein
MNSQPKFSMEAASKLSPWARLRLSQKQHRCGDSNVLLAIKLFLLAVHFKKDAISKIFRFTGSDGDMLLNSHILKCTSAASGLIQKIRRWSVFTRA